LCPNINHSTRRVLSALGLSVITPSDTGCCAALAQHLGHLERAQAQIRRNIDAWWPHVQSGVNTLISNASGCGVMVKDYGHVMREDALYAEKARTISELCKDLSELLPTWVKLLKPQLRQEQVKALGPMVFHPPCTLQHGQKINGVVERALKDLGFDITPPAHDAHLCCGSAGTYSVLEPVLSKALTRFRLPWKWDGRPSVLASRATDETGETQPTRAAWVAQYATGQFYHFNGIQSWAVAADGTVSNVYL
jgi:glycolate oxidase iron-sulfur subunit